MTLIYQWIDVFWIVVAFFTVHRDHRWWTIGFIASCMFMMRMEVEIMVGIGNEHGILPFLQSHIYNRLLVAYSLIYIIFFVMAYYSRDTRGAIFMAATISFFFFALIISVLVMVL